MTFIARSGNKPVISANTQRAKSPLLFSLFDKLDPQKQLRILDTGAANASTIETLSRFYCKLWIADSWNEICALSPEQAETDDNLHDSFDRAFHLHKQQPAKLDVILLWDLPNYLDGRILSDLIQYLQIHMHAQTLLHCYIYTSSQMPAVPGHFAIDAGQTVVIRHQDCGTRPCPAYYQEALQKIMSPFRVRRSVLQANGMQEYLLGR